MQVSWSAWVTLIIPKWRKALPTEIQTEPPRQTTILQMDARHLLNNNNHNAPPVSRKLAVDPVTKRAESLQHASFLKQLNNTYHTELEESHQNELSYGHSHFNWFTNTIYYWTQLDHQNNLFLNQPAFRFERDEWDVSNWELTLPYLMIWIGGRLMSVDECWWVLVSVG